VYCSHGCQEEKKKKKKKKKEDELRAFKLNRYKKTNKQAQTHMND
jgi:hypothetical protein